MVGEIIAWIIVILIIVLIVIIHIVGYFITSPRPYEVKPDDVAKLQWRNINYAVKEGKKKKLLLKNISGEANPGEIVAVMGSSGCGKTTLLNLLSGNPSRSEGNDYFAGQLIFNDNQITNSLLLDKQCCFVYQEDTLVSSFTVDEYLNFIALLLKGSRKENMERLKNVKKLLNIEHIGKNLIGNSVFSEISGGQRRRVSLAEGLLNDCKLIFLDEPTTGLSAADAQELFQVLRDIASSGYTIIMTIHQPRQSIFSSIDKLLLLSSGKQVYFGPTFEVSDHFSCNEFPLPKEENSADAIIDILDDSNNADVLTDIWKNDYENDWDYIDNIEIKQEYTNIISYLLWRLRGVYLVPKELIVLFIFHLRISVRDKWSFFIPILVSSFFGVVYGLLFRDVPNEVDEFSDQLNAVWRVIGHFATYSVVTALYFNLRANSDIQLLIGRYNSLSHGIIWMLRLLIINLSCALFSSGLSVIIFGWGAKTFFTFVYFNFCMLNFAGGFTIGLATFAGSYAVALSINGINMAISFALSGYYVLPSDMFIIFRWMVDITLFHQLIDAAATIQLGDIEYSCDDPLICPIKGSDLLEIREYDGNVIYDFAISIIWAILGLIIFSIFIYWPIYKTRKNLQKRLSPSEIKLNEIKLSELEVTPHYTTTNGKEIESVNNENDIKSDNNEDFFEMNDDFSLAFEEINCYTSDDFQILHNVCGFLKSGEILAVMGPSGSGKTTLLKCLTGIQNLNLYSDMSIYLNNHKLTKPLLKSGIATFMTQDDILSEFCTVRECLEFVCDLRSWDCSFSNRKKMIDTLLIQMKLKHIENSTIDKLSGGEKKRVSLAQTFLSKKKIILLDEPTSGLSGSDSRLIMKIISKFVKKYNIIVIITIHQPRTSIFMDFNHVLLMSKGYPIYYGTPSNVSEYFASSISLNPDVPNIADAMLDAIMENECDLKLIKSLNNDHQIIHQREIKNNIVQVKQSNENDSLTNFKKEKRIPIFKPFFCLCNEIIVLSNYYGKIQYRKSGTMKSFIIQTILLGLFYGLLYLQLDNTAETIPSLTGGLFLVLTATAFMANAQGFVVEQLLWFWLHDSLIGLHRLWTVYFVEVLITNFRLTLGCIVICSITYWMIGFDTVFYKFLVYILTFHITWLWFYIVAVTVCVIEWDITVSSILCYTFLTLSLSTTGYLLKLDSIPTYLSWFAAINPIRYTNEIIVVNEFLGQTFQCEDEEDYIGDCPVSGEEVIESFGYDNHPILRDVLLAYGIIFIAFFIGIIGLYIKINYRTPKFISKLYYNIKMMIKSRIYGIDTNSDEYISNRLTQTLSNSGYSKVYANFSSNVTNSGIIQSA